jgi:hypothetical protein
MTLHRQQRRWKQLYEKRITDRHKYERRRMKTEWLKDWEKRDPPPLSGLGTGYHNEW